MTESRNDLPLYDRVLNSNITLPKSGLNTLFLRLSSENKVVPKTESGRLPILRKFTSYEVTSTPEAFSFGASAVDFYPGPYNPGTL